MLNNKIEEKNKNQYQLISQNEKQTKYIAKKIAEIFDSSDIILLDGDLGAGKTHFVKGFAEYFNYQGEVTSPTFNIAFFYDTNDIRLIHIDLYRLESIEEFTDLGIEEYFEESIVLIEWGEKIAEYLEEYFSVTIETTDADINTRKIIFAYKGENYASKFKLIAEKLSIK